MYLYFEEAKGCSLCIWIYYEFNYLTPDCNFFDFLGGKHIHISDKLVIILKDETQL